VPVSSIHEEPSTVVAVVIETMDDSAAVSSADHPTVEEESQQLEEPPPENGRPVCKHLIWALAFVAAVVAVVAGVVIAVVVALNSKESPSPPTTPPAAPTDSPTAFAKETKLTASDGAVNDLFGISVAIAGDTIVVGAQGDDDNGTGSGSAYLFMRTGLTWTQQAKLTASDAAASDHFGNSVAIAGDTIVVGAIFDDDSGTESGSAYVFTRAGTTWTEQAKLTASDGAANDWFGTSVAIAGDTIVVGAIFNKDNGTSNGSALFLYAQEPYGPSKPS